MSTDERRSRMSARFQMPAFFSSVSYEVAFPLGELSGSLTATVKSSGKRTAKEAFSQTLGPAAKALEFVDAVA